MKPHAEKELLSNSTVSLSLILNQNYDSFLLSHIPKDIFEKLILKLNTVIDNLQVVFLRHHKFHIQLGYNYFKVL